jgi:hypothetical protein
LIAFGDGMQNKDTVKIKGLQSGVTGFLRKKLIQRGRQFKNVLVDINEYLTSQVHLFSFFLKKKARFSFSSNRYVLAARVELYNQL